MTGAGDFARRRIIFDKRGTSSDGAGGVETVWLQQFEVSAKATHLRGGENVIAARLEGRHPVVFRVRQSAQARLVTTDWRIRDSDGVAYAIRDITRTEDRMYLDLLAESGVAA